MKPIRVMYVFHFNSAFLGGAAQSLMDMLDGLGNRVRPVLAIGEDAKLDDLLENRGVPYYKMRLSNDVVSIDSSNKEEEERVFYYSYETAKKLAEIIQKEDIELVHINSSVGIVGAIAALMTHVPYVWHIRELMEEQFVKKFVNIELKKRLLGRADRLITISDFVYRTYMKKYQLRSERIYNGFAVGRFKNEIIRGRKYDNVFLAAAMISPGKGQWDAIKAVEMLLAEGHKDIQLIIAGHGEVSYIWALKKYIVQNGLESNIKIMPYQQNLSRLRREASYALTCSQNEALGRVTVEAMLAGNIVIGAESGGTTEIIGRHEERGYLYHINDVQSLAEAMRKAIKLPSPEKDQLAEAAQKYAEEVFGSEQYCDKILEIYDSVFRTPREIQDDVLIQELEERYNLVNCLQENIETVNRLQYKKVIMVNKLLTQWLEIKQRGMALETYFKINNIHSIAIYGMGDLGRRLYDELENSEIKVLYILDRNPGSMGNILKFTSVDGIKMEVDAIVVTMISPEKIIRGLYAKGYERVISLAEILDEAESI